MRKYHLIIFLFFLLYFSRIYAQISVITNSSNVRDPRLFLINPAGMIFHDQALFVSGYKLFYVSLGDEHPGNFYTGLCSRLLNVGAVGLTLQQFHLGTFYQTQVDMNYALSLWKKKLAIGARVGLLNIDYNSEKLKPIHLNDPLLSGNLSKNMVTLGLGIITNPFARLYLGFSANHLNRPDLSLSNSKQRKEISANLSAMYLHSIFRPYISLEREDNETYLNAGLETWLLRNRAMLRSNYCAERLTLGAGYDFNFWRLDYEYDYYLSDLQQISNGSHQVAVSFKIGSWRGCKKPDFKISVEPLDSITSIQQGIYYSQTALYRIKVLPQNGFSRRVKLSLDNVPDDLSVHLSSLKITPGETCTLRVTPRLQCPSEKYPLIIKGKACCKKRRDSSSIHVRLPWLVPKIYSHPTELTIREKHRIFEASPPLNYVFFDSSDARIPTGRYAPPDSEKSFPTHQQYFNRVATISEQYRHVLNVLGRRLKHNPDYKILLVGCNSGVGAEKNNLALSRSRAQSVKDYFVTIWGISPGRIEVKERNLPAYPSTLNDPRGLQENRRVEIHPQHGSDQILAADTTTIVETGLSDSVCVFSTYGTVAEAGVKNWQLAVRGNDGGVLYMIKGDTTLPQSETWDWREAARNAPSFRDSLTFSLSITDNHGQDRVASGLPIRILRMRQDTIIERSRLLFFAFDSCRIDFQSTHLKAEIDSIVTKFKRHAFAKVKVRGYTDVIGDTIINVPLSQCRAQAVREELIRRGIPEDGISAEGFGPKFPIMTNDLPEGRMMNRRVEVDVIYPR